MSQYKLFIDGASRGNPGVSGIGFVLYDGVDIVKEFSEFTGKKTNNEAEYLALIRGIEEVKSRKISDLTVFSDSQLLVKQLLGEYKLKSETLKKYFDTAKNLTKDLSIKFIWVPRKDNSVADSLANKAIDDENKINLIERSFFGKTTCFKVQLNSVLEIYFHMGLLDQKKKSWTWIKAKMSENEIGQIINLLENKEGECSFFHQFKGKKTQIWCMKSKDYFSIKIDSISKKLSIGEYIVLREFVTESLRKKFFIST